MPQTPLVMVSQKGEERDQLPVRRAVLSTFDKTDLVKLGKALAESGVELISTSGTAKALREAGLSVTDISEITGFPEILGGRVKTLHPKVYGGLLSVRGNAEHDSSLASNGIKPIDLVVTNLYPFQTAVAQNASFDTCIENIDIGGPSMIRAAAKNCAAVCVLTRPSQYESFIAEMTKLKGSVSLSSRRALAHSAFATTAAYDASITQYFQSQEGDDVLQPHIQSAEPVFPLKYGLNPHQSAAICQPGTSTGLPLRIVHGKPGYINLLDAINAWQLVRELKEQTQLPAAASFKHVSPAGAAIGLPLSTLEREVFDVAEAANITPAAAAYIRARNGDPLCSFGEFVGLSEVVDQATAVCLKAEVADGIIAPGFEPEALEILKQKKGGSFIILEGRADFTPPKFEYREICGMGFRQERNAKSVSMEQLKDIQTKRTDLSQSASLDLIVATVAIKYTQSNSVAYSKNGMTIGIGAGQQSRIDCVKLAGRKADSWALRFHPKVMGLQFKEGVKRHEKVNARLQFIHGDCQLLDAENSPVCFKPGQEHKLEDAEKKSFLESVKGVALSSDAFFPFSDCIEESVHHGVEYVVHPGGSLGDPVVVEAADRHNLILAHSGVRLFHH